MPTSEGEITKNHNKDSCLEQFLSSFSDRTALESYGTADVDNFYAISI